MTNQPQTQVQANAQTQNVSTPPENNFPSAPGQQQQPQLTAPVSSGASVAAQAQGGISSAPAAHQAQAQPQTPQRQILGHPNTWATIWRDQADPQNFEETKALYVEGLGVMLRTTVVIGGNVSSSQEFVPGAAVAVDTATQQPVIVWAKRMQ